MLSSLGHFEEVLVFTLFLPNFFNNRNISFFKLLQHLLEPNLVTLKDDTDLMGQAITNQRPQCEQTHAGKVLRTMVLLHGVDLYC